jgi:CDP-glycerol glycerophosphotransferase (TagB/SpsB family)
VNDLAVRVRTALVRVSFAIARWLPLRRRVVLATAHLPTLTGNLAELRDALARLPDIDTRVLAVRVSESPSGLLSAAIQAVRAGFHLATARVFVVDDYFFPMYVVRPRRGTTFVQTWHASGAFKRFGYSVAGQGFGRDAAFHERVPIHSNYDLCLVSAMRFAPFYAEAFGLPVERFASRFGIPRTDLFFDARRVAAASEAIRREYAIPRDRRVVLYAPTFRGDSITRARSPQALDLAELRQAIGEDHVVLVREHPFVRQRAAADPRLAGFAIDVSDHPDIHELMLVSDILVTDYSSAIYEFSLLERPIGFLAPDRLAYERERGFYFDYVTGVPGPIFETTAALAGWLRAASFDLERIRRFRADSFDVADGRATARLVEGVIVPALH